MCAVPHWQRGNRDRLQLDLQIRVSAIGRTLWAWGMERTLLQG
jgi:hypothetical protein